MAAAGARAGAPQCASYATARLNATELNFRVALLRDDSEFALATRRVNRYKNYERLNHRHIFAVSDVHTHTQTHMRPTISSGLFCICFIIVYTPLSASSPSSPSSPPPPRSHRVYLFTFIQVHAGDRVPSQNGDLIGQQRQHEGLAEGDRYSGGDIAARYARRQ